MMSDVTDVDEFCVVSGHQQTVVTASRHADTRELHSQTGHQSHLGWAPQPAPP